jgi:hypothetical protein
MDGAKLSMNERAFSDRELLGRMVRDIWITWAREQPNPKPSWLKPWDELSEPDREVDRRIGEGIAAFATQQQQQRIETLQEEIRRMKA